MQFHLQRAPTASHTGWVIVCICRGVSDRQVRLAVLGGACTLREVALSCNAGRGCGACHEMVRDMIDEGTRPANDNRPGAAPEAGADAAGAARSSTTW
jgi:bacterioferritin-associated ferredoxin